MIITGIFNDVSFIIFIIKMNKSRRLIIFSELEKAVFYEVPNFDESNREEYFDFSEDEIKLIKRSKNEVGKQNKKVSQAKRLNC